MKTATQAGFQANFEYIEGANDQHQKIPVRQKLVRYDYYAEGLILITNSGQGAGVGNFEVTASRHSWRDAAKSMGTRSALLICGHTADH